MNTGRMVLWWNHQSNESDLYVDYYSLLLLLLLLLTIYHGTSTFCNDARKLNTPPPSIRRRCSNDDFRFRSGTDLYDRFRSIAANRMYNSCGRSVCVYYSLYGSDRVQGIHVRKTKGYYGLGDDRFAVRATRNAFEIERNVFIGHHCCIDAHIIQQLLYLCHITLVRFLFVRAIIISNKLLVITMII